MSLVADYSDSEPDEECETNDVAVQNKANDKPKHDESLDISIVKQQKKVEDTSARESGNFLMSSEADSESSESDSDDTDLQKRYPTSRKHQSKVKLDNPFRTLGAATNVSKEDSVFRNPFRDKEEKKIAVLEHHVKMTDKPETALIINGKKICWNYRKRKCYLGTQCPYAHDSDVPLTDEQLKEQRAEDDLHRAAGGSSNVAGFKNIFPPTSTKSHLPGTASVVAGGYDSSAFFSSPHLGGGTKPATNNDITDFTEPPHSKSKKRVGLTNSLIPPKKALNLYHKTKDA